MSLRGIGEGEVCAREGLPSRVAATQSPRDRSRRDGNEEGEGRFRAMASYEAGRDRCCKGVPGRGVGPVLAQARCSFQGRTGFASRNLTREKFKLAPSDLRAIEPHPAATPEPPRLLAGVAELVDASDLGSDGASRGGSSPSARTSFPTAKLAGLGRRAWVGSDSLGRSRRIDIGRAAFLKEGEAAADEE
jgi:hypothetical protein